MPVHTHNNLVRLSLISFFVTNIYCETATRETIQNSVNYRERANSEVHSPSVIKSGPGMVEKNSAVVNVQMPPAPIKSQEMALSLQLMANQSNFRGQISLDDVGNIDANKLTPLTSLMLSLNWHLFNFGKYDNISFGPLVDLTYGSVENSARTQTNYSLDSATLSASRVSTGLFLEKPFWGNKNFKTGISIVVDYLQMVQTDQSSFGQFFDDSWEVAFGLNQKFMFSSNFYLAGYFRYGYHLGGINDELRLPNTQLFIGVGREL